MTGYRVHPAGVNAVVSAVVASAEPIATAVGNLEWDAQCAATGASSAIVGAALQDAFGVLGGQLQAVQTRIPAVLRGTAAAGKAVVDGDDEMATRIIGLASAALGDTARIRSGGRAEAR